MSSVTAKTPARWRARLTRELESSPTRDYVLQFVQHPPEGWRATSDNYDTVVSLDFPHYCSAATELCGGAAGWCYTFQGHQATAAHGRKVSLLDALARYEPEWLADRVAAECATLTAAGALPYANLRFCGSGELAPHHLPVLVRIAKSGVRVWGFTRKLRLAIRLRGSGVSVIVSADRSTPQAELAAIATARVPVAYTSAGVQDAPPAGAFVTFPVHKGGRVAEVVEAQTLCPKVVAEYFDEARTPGTCQLTCRRCHDARAT